MQFSIKSLCISGRGSFLLWFCHFSFALREHEARWPAQFLHLNCTCGQCLSSGVAYRLTRILIYDLPHLSRLSISSVDSSSAFLGSSPYYFAVAPDFLWMKTNQERKSGRILEIFVWQSVYLIFERGNIVEMGTFLQNITVEAWVLWSLGIVFIGCRMYLGLLHISLTYSYPYPFLKFHTSHND